MAIPDFQSVMRPVLQAVGDGVPLPLSALRVRIADVFQLTEEERKERLPSGNQTVINNRVGWARTYLNKAGLLKTEQRNGADNRPGAGGACNWTGANHRELAEAVSGIRRLPYG